ncbi:MAG: transketolase family protein [Spirochaetaceae bacterium]|jgi:transketolase|nr:transketolase family protein [Spirochaetaceae bacterium]
MSEAKSLRTAYGEALVKFGGENEKVVVCDADLSHATMTGIFKAKFPERFFNFGIAETNMVCAAAGMAYEGLIPFVSTFALFGAGRAYEQIRNSVAYVGANVKFALTHAGLSVGEDGGSHQSIEDIALMRVLPGMTVIVPCDPIETEKAVRAAIEINGPVYLRIARPVCQCITAGNDSFIPGKANQLAQGNDIAIFATGLMVPEALEAVKILEGSGIKASLINFHTIKPFDKTAAIEAAKATGAVLTAEEHSVIGGLGSAAAESLAGLDGVKFARIGIEDKFGKSGTPPELFEEYGLTAAHIAETAKKLLQK